VSAPASAIGRSPLSSRAGFVVMALLALVMVTPLLWTVGLSLKSNGELLRDTASVFRAPYTLENYGSLFGNAAVFRWLFNSAVVSLCTTFGVLALSSLAGYGFARLEFPGRRLLFAFVLFGLAIPEQSVIIPRHQMFSALHLHNTYPGLFLPSLAAPFGVFLMTQYFKAIPRELDEAARLDGASRFAIFWKVLLPLTLPAQATLGIFTFLASWNEYWWPLISATRSEMFTITVGVASSQINFAQTSGLGFLMAQAVFASAPILLVYVFFQKYIVRAVAGAAVR
jgi:multiple sugar transport system permease protein